MSKPPPQPFKVLLVGDSSGRVSITSTRTFRPVADWNAHTDSVLGAEEWNGQIITQPGQQSLYLEVEPPLLTDAASALNISTPILASSMDVNALNYCRFSLYPIDSESTRALLALPNLIESELIDVWELPGKSRLHAAIGTVKGAPPRKPFSDEGRDIYKTGIVMSLHVSQTESYMRILAAYESGAVTLWTRPLSSNPRSIEGNGWNNAWSVKHHLEAVMGMAVSCDNTIAASVSADHLLCRYNLDPELGADDAYLAPYETKHLGNGGVTFRADGRVLGVAGWDGVVRLYSTGFRRVDGVGAIDRNRKVRSLGTLEHFKESCFALAFANEVLEDTAILGSIEDEGRASLEILQARSRWLAVGGETGRVAIWELDSFEKRWSFMGKSRYGNIHR